MLDPLLVLPNELWNLCIQFAIAGQLDGPLAFILVSHSWERLLCDTPSLWNQIYVQNGEDEIARISTFLHYSKSCPLHVDIMTKLPTMDSLQLIAENISRFATISIRPGASDTKIVLHTHKWKQAASHILARLSSNGLLPSDIESTSCFGISFKEMDQLHYRVVVMQFTIRAGVVNTEQSRIAPADARTFFRLWQEHTASAVRDSVNRDLNTRLDSIHSIGKLASYAQCHNAIMIAIPSFITLLGDDDESVRSAAIGALWKFAVHGELREALTLAMPLIIELLEFTKPRTRRAAAVSVIDKLAGCSALRHAIGAAIPSLIELLHHASPGTRQTLVYVVYVLADHTEIHQAIAATTSLLIELRKSGDSYVQSMVVSTFGRLADHVELHDAIGAAIASLIGLRQHPSSGIRRTFDSVLDKLANLAERRAPSST